MPWKLFPAEEAVGDRNAHNTASILHTMNKRRQEGAAMKEDFEALSDDSIQGVLGRLQEDLSVRNVVMLNRLSDIEKKLDRLYNLGENNHLQRPSALDASSAFQQLSSPTPKTLKRRVSFSDAQDLCGKPIPECEMTLPSCLKPAETVPSESRHAEEKRNLCPTPDQVGKAASVARTPLSSGGASGTIWSQTAHHAPSLPRTAASTGPSSLTAVVPRIPPASQSWSRMTSPMSDGGVFMKTHSSRVDDLIKTRIGGATNKHSRMRLRALQFLEDPGSTPASLWFTRLMSLLVVVNVVFSLLQAQLTPLIAGSFPIALQGCFDVICILEVLARFWVSPHQCAFFKDFFNWVDVCAGLAFIPRMLQFAAFVNGQTVWSWEESLYTVVPVIWLLKLLRNFEQVHLLCSAFKIAFEALPVLLFTLAILVLSFACVIFHVEPRDNIDAPPRALWFTIVTMMTVGYGDITPASSTGNIMTGALMVGSQLYMAIPLGIVGGAFSSIWVERDRLLLMRRTRQRLSRWGYSAQEILELIFCYDTHKAGGLDLADFRAMMSDMKLGLDDERVRNLFQVLDSDGSGRITDIEFLSALYPGCNPYEIGFVLSNSWSGVSPSELGVDG